MSEQQGSSKTSPMMILAAAVGVFAAPVIAIVLIVQLVLSIQAGHVDKDDPRMADAAVKERIKSFGEVKAIDPSAPRVEKTGEAVYTEVCASCQVPVHWARQSMATKPIGASATRKASIPW